LFQTSKKNYIDISAILLLVIFSLILALGACSKDYSWDYYMLASENAFAHKQYQEGEKQLALAGQAAEKCKDKDSQQYYGRLQGTLLNLADLYKNDHRYAESEQIYFRCLSILEQHLKADYLNTSSVLNSLGEIYEEQGKHDKAELFYKRSLVMAEKLVAPGPSDLPPQSMSLSFFPIPSSDDLPPQSLFRLAGLYQHQNKYLQAEILFEHWAQILEKAFGHSSAGVSICLTDVAELYRDEGKNVLADKCEARARVIDAQREAKAKSFETQRKK